MTISTKDRDTTLLPARTKASTKLESFRVPALKGLCPIRMAEADKADGEVVALAEELSQLMRKPPRKKTQERATRGNSDRPSVCRRKPRKAH